MILDVASPRTHKPKIVNESLPCDCTSEPSKLTNGISTVNVLKFWNTLSVILLPAHPASFAHNFLFQRVPGCNSMADLSLKIVFWTH